MIEEPVRNMRVRDRERESVDHVQTNHIHHLHLVNLVHLVGGGGRRIFALRIKHF